MEISLLKFFCSHHMDHCGGNDDAVKLFSVPVYGGDDRIQALTNKVGKEDTISLGELTLRVLCTPCHTSGHVCYYVDQGQGQRAVFTGDTLFQGGCGRFFEGTAPQMETALNEVLGALPHDTQVFCGHEYTVANLQYGHHADPDNKELAARLQWAKEQREKGLPTIPSTIGEEKQINVFMRTKLLPKYGSNPVDVMGALREEKNNWSPPKL